MFLGVTIVPKFVPTAEQIITLKKKKKEKKVTQLALRTQHKSFLTSNTHLPSRQHISGAHFSRKHITSL